MDNKIQGIKCEVCNCEYHSKDNCCTAGAIHVGGTNAHSSSETVCETFCPCGDNCGCK